MLICQKYSVSQKASLGPWILSFSLPAQPDTDRKRMRVLVLDGLLRERIRIFVTPCFSPRWVPVAHCGRHRGVIWVPSEYLQPKARSYKRSRRPLVARVCRVPDPSMTLYVITLQEPDDKTCFRSLEEILSSAAPGWGRKQAMGSLLATLNTITSSSSWGGCKVGQISSAIYWILSSWMTVKKQRSWFGAFKGPELPAAESSGWVLVTLGLLQDVAADSQCGKAGSTEMRPERRRRQLPSLL